MIGSSYLVRDGITPRHVLGNGGGRSRKACVAKALKLGLKCPILPGHIQCAISPDDVEARAVCVSPPGHKFSVVNGKKKYFYLALKVLSELSLLEVSEESEVSEFVR